MATPHDTDRSSDHRTDDGTRPNPPGDQSAPLAPLARLLARQAARELLEQEAEARE